METQQVVVIGDPLPCDVSGCRKSALVLLRHLDKEGVNGIAYCEAHWLAARRAYVPLDSHEVIGEAAALVGAPVLSGRNES